MGRKQQVKGFMFSVKLDMEGMKAHLKEAQQVLPIIEKKVEAKRKEIQTSINRIENKRAKLKKERIILRNKLDRIEFRILNKFTNNECYPCYGIWQYSSRIQTNIHLDVLEAIKKTVNISKLKHSQVAQLVNNMINKEFSKSKRRRDHRRRQDEITALCGQLWEDERKINITSGLSALLYDLQHCKGRIHFLTQKINNPKKYQKQLELETIRKFAMSPAGTNKVYNYLKEMRKK